MQHAHARAHAVRALMHVILRRPKELDNGKLPGRLLLLLFIFSSPFFSKSPLSLSFDLPRSSPFDDFRPVRLLHALVRARKSYAEAVTRLFGKILSAKHRITTSDRLRGHCDQEREGLLHRCTRHARVNRDFQPMRNPGKPEFRCRGHARFLFAHIRIRRTIPYARLTLRWKSS